MWLYWEGHDGVDNIIVVLLEGLDSLLPRDTGLLHDELNVLGLKTRVIDLLLVFLVFLLLFVVVLLVLDGLALALVVMVVVVAGVVVRSGLSLGELLGSGSLGLGVQVLDLGLTENAGAGSDGA
jgi:hypothetical protein